MPPDAEALLIQALKAQPEVATLCGGRIGTRLGTTYPAIRVTLLGGLGRSVAGTRWATLQWESWGNGTDSVAEHQASDLGRAVEGVVEQLAGVYASGHITSAWLDGLMSHSPDPTSNRERYLGSIGLITQ